MEPCDSHEGTCDLLLIFKVGALSGFERGERFWFDGPIGMETAQFTVLGEDALPGGYRELHCGRV